MMQTKSPNLIEIKQWTRWFAVEHNNRAWQLAELAERSDEQDREMIDAAHAAALHWSRVGQVVNTLRADQLLAWVYALNGDATRADEYAQQSRELIAAQIEGLSDWDRAFQSLVDAIVARAANNHASHQALNTNAATARALLTNPEYLRIFDQFAIQAGVTF